MLEGIGGYEYASYSSGYPNSAHTFVAVNKCVHCHVTTAPFQAGPPVIQHRPATRPAEKRACAAAGCHPAIDTTQARTCVQLPEPPARVRQHRHRARRPPRARDAADRRPTASSAPFQLRVLESDQSHGVHNTAYAKALWSRRSWFTPFDRCQPVDGILPRVYHSARTHPSLRPFDRDLILAPGA